MKNVLPQSLPRLDEAVTYRGITSVVFLLINNAEKNKNKQKCWKTKCTITREIK